MTTQKKKSAMSLKAVTPRQGTTQTPAIPKATQASIEKAATLTPARAAQIIEAPETNSAAITFAYQAGWGEEGLPADYKVGMLDLYSELQAQVDQVTKGDLSRVEAMLLCQAHALQSMFLDFALRGKGNRHVGQLQTITNLALKAQNQCRATLETLAEIKNPRPQASFVKQQNVAVNQQVNNGTQPPAIAPARAEIIESTNELLGAKGHERLEQGAPRTTGEGYKAVATVAPFDGTTDGRRQEQGKTKLNKARPAIKRVA